MSAGIAYGASCLLTLSASLAVGQAAAPASQEPPGTPAAVQQPRPFGYVLGDVLSQRIQLRHQGQPFEPDTLPASERVGNWLSRRSSRVETDPDGQRWLHIEYQLINAPETLTAITVPELKLPSSDGKLVLTVPAWPISAAPLTPRESFRKGGLQALRPDHPVPLLPTAHLQQRLEYAVTALAVTLLTWLSLWLVRVRRGSTVLPFARALRIIGRSGDQDARSWIALHRAFDETAGRAVQLQTLGRLFSTARHLESQRAAIENFYMESSRRFFGSPAATTFAPLPGPGASRDAAFSLRSLCATLRQLERRNQP